MKIDTPSARGKLKARSEPHWHKLRRGGYIGYRKQSEGGSWICRWRDELGKQHYKSLGDLKDYDPADQFDQASKQASEWFEQHRHTAPTRYTLKDAADDYLKHIRVNNGPESEKRSRWQIERHVTSALGDILLEDLKHSQVNNWLLSLVKDDDDPEVVRKSKDSANRNLTILKALLNHAKRNKRVSSDHAWADIQAFAKVSASRKVILNDAQIKRLMEQTTGGFHDLAEGLLLTGMRPGKEPLSLLVEQFDPVSKTLDIQISKTGPRTVYLSDDAVKFFKRMTKDKTPKAPIFTNGGNRWHPKEAERIMKDVAKSAKLPAGSVLYSLRHTYISKAIVAGLPLQVIAENCGTSIRMIETNYAKFVSQYRHAVLNQVKML